MSIVHLRPDSVEIHVDGCDKGLALIGDTPNLAQFRRLQIDDIEGGHATRHADGGVDEITTPLDPRAYPLLYGLIAERPEPGVRGRLYFATDEATLYLDDSNVWSVVAEPAAAGAAHATSHADGGLDEINTALDPRAYPMLSGTLAARPAFGVAGRFYWTDDEHILYRDSGAAWVKVAVADYADLSSIPSSFTPSAHVVATTTNLGAEHTVSGLTSGQVLRAFSATDARFQSIQASDLPGHVLATDTALGSQHTISGTSAGQVLRASSSSAANFQALAAGDLPGHVLADTSGLGAQHTVSGLTANQCLRATGATTAAFGTGVLDNNARIEVKDNTSTIGTRRCLDLTDTATVFWSVTDSGGSEKVIVAADCYRTVVTLGSDVASTASTSFQNINGLSFLMASGTNYRVYAILLYTTSANTIGLRVGWSGPTMTHSAFTTRTAPGGTTGGVPAAGTDNEWVNWDTAADSGTTSGASMTTTTGNMIIFEGIFRPSSSTTFQLRFAPETATANGVIIEAGSSLEWW